jgi:hypothetical protein
MFLLTEFAMVVLRGYRAKLPSSLESAKVIQHPGKNGRLTSLLVRSSLWIPHCLYPDSFRPDESFSQFFLSGKSNRRANHFELKSAAGLRHLNPMSISLFRDRTCFGSLSLTEFQWQFECYMCRYNGNACLFFDRGKEHSLQKKAEKA